MDLFTIIREQLAPQGAVSDQDRMALLEMKVPSTMFASYGKNLEEKVRYFRKHM